MAIKKLSFKGDSAPTKKRKIAHSSSTTLSASNNLEKQEKSDLRAPVARASDNNNDEDAEGWVDAESLEDLKGPAMLVVDNTTTISADHLGSVFLISVQSPTSTSLNDVDSKSMLNITEDGEAVTVAPGVVELEPHDVRQVFVLSKVMDSTDSFSLKSGKSGKHLARSKVGTRCDSEAIGVRETWTIKRESHGWSLQAHDGCHLTVSDDIVTCSDPDLQSGRQYFTIRIQRRNRAQRATRAGRGGTFALTSRKELEDKVGRKLSIDEVDDLRRAQRRGELGEAILDLRVKGRSDKFG